MKVALLIFLSMTTLSTTVQAATVCLSGPREGDGLYQWFQSPSNKLSELTALRAQLEGPNRWVECHINLTKRGIALSQKHLLWEAKGEPIYEIGRETEVDSAANF